MQNLVTLWIIDFNEIIAFDQVPNGIIYLTSYKDKKTEIVYDGNVYNYVGIESGGFRSEINGQLPEPKISFDKQSLIKLPQYMAIKEAFTAETGQVFFDWRGARITRIRTTSNYLDNGSNPNPNMNDSQEFIVDQVTRTTDSSIEVGLTVGIGADRLTNQSVQELGFNRCGLRYRIWNKDKFTYTKEEAGGCPYGNASTQSDWSDVPDFGKLYFDETDRSTTEEFDVCSYTVLGCQKRFDPNKDGLALPFLGKYKDTGNDTSGGGGV